MNEKIYNKLLEIKNSGGAGLHIFENPKIIYLHLSKCAGTTIHKSLTNACKEVHVDLKEVAENFDQYFSFTVVRNIYSKVLSEYNHEINSNLHHFDFDTWLDLVCKRIKIDGGGGCFADYSNQYNELDQKSFCVIGDKPYLSYVGRFENLDEVFYLLNLKSNGKMTFSKLNTTNYKNKRKMNRVQVELIKERFKEDIEYFGFDYD